MNAEQKARELLAEEYERDAFWRSRAEKLRSGDADVCRQDALILRAITRALQQRPSEEEVEAAAKRIAVANCKMEGYDPDVLWAMLDESARLATIRMARAALGVDQVNTYTWSEGTAPAPSSDGPHRVVVAPGKEPAP